MQVTTASFLLGRGEDADKEFLARRTSSSLAVMSVTLSVDLGIEPKHQAGFSSAAAAGTTREEESAKEGGDVGWFSPSACGGPTEARCYGSKRKNQRRKKGWLCLLSPCLRALLCQIGGGVSDGFPDLAGDVAFDGS
jgi:hypothetical protein